jgi:multiple sugar transport system ATP-binding protein
MNIIEAKAVKEDSGVYFAFNEFKVKIPQSKATVIEEKGYIGKDVYLGVRPEDLHDEQAFIASSPESVIKADVEVTEMLGAEVYLYLDLEGQKITARVDPRSKAKSGDKIEIALDANTIHAFDKSTEETIVN